MIDKKIHFVGKAIFFQKEKILAIGDLHLGYESALRSGGLELPLKQFEEVKEELQKTLEYIRARYGKIEKIIFLGDVKHHFNFLATEKEEIQKLISFLRKYLDENKIIFIRGNHEKNEKSGKYCDYYIEKDIAFIHGDRDFLEIYDKCINIVVMGHIHPTITLSDKMNIKREKYKSFLIGRHKKKDFIILPSFIGITEGISANEFADEKGYDFSIIPLKELENFDVYVVQDPNISSESEALCFGKLKNLREKV
jgi:putative SbcD/Mre11-related phosphoesterase